ncbi:Hypothetical predicted protein [Mytilus galloprovincialis]|uniref:Endonuclease/exonuclease/phosphatase domain-containing protein n=1 Tax=Mytilus galloprovincialis TaxID=29158 RepID=A0A8B6F3L7_MYTGA|nr:Hypothetical predicted protein [Mytilus galloprovincialis]
MSTPNPPDIIGYCETFLGKNTSDREIDIPGYILQRKDRQSDGGGGWAVYLTETTSFSRKNDFEISNIETMWFEVKPSYKKSFLLCFVYRPPKSLIGWIDKFEDEIKIAMKYNSDVILMGDFNINCLQPNKIPQRWLTALETYNFQQVIKEPTRVTNESKTLIDHIYVTSLSMVKEAHVSKYSISDHYPICMTRQEKLYDKKHSHSTITYRNFKTFNEQNYLKDLKSAPFQHIEFENDPSVCIEMWYNIFNNILNKHAPIVKKRVKKDRQPEWYNKEISYARKMRDKYHSLGMWAEYRFWRNRTKHIIDKSKQKYYNDMIKDSKDSKTLWKCIHSLNPSNPSKPHELITTGDHKTTDHKEIANTFNNYFTSCVEKLRHIRAPCNSNFNTLTNYVQMKSMKKRHNKLLIPPVKVSELFAEITKLDVKTSSGSDNIGPKILKPSAPFIASSLTYIFNRMIDTGIYPSVLKNAKVAPILIVIQEQ